MRILNIHRRCYALSKNQIADLLSTLSSPSDQIWPKEKWPKMKLDKGLEKGSKGGHGPIKYFVESHDPGKQIVFRFTKPMEFKGIHKFDIISLNSDQTELVHTIDMEVNFTGAIKWHLAIKWLHNALIEDGLDKIHNKATGDTVTTPWNPWVRFLRRMLR